jgi:glycerophosphoryl diester phosphodiesterase
MKWFSVLVIVLVILQSSCTKNSTALPKVIVLGHAGTSLHRDRAIFPANSFESIKYAIDFLDADGVEVDVQMTKDSVLVLFHDNYLEFSTDFSGCVSEYKYDEIKNAKLDNTGYKLIALEQVLKYIDSRHKTIFLDIKAYDYCNESSISVTEFNYGLSNSMSQISEECIAKIVINNVSSSFLNQVNHPNKCIEIINIENGVNQLNTFGFQSVLVDLVNISTKNIGLLENVNWGVLGIKDEWTIDEGIKLMPKFAITDNIAYTNKVTD